MPPADTAVRADVSLNDVRAIIPAECYERPTGRAVVALVQAGVLHIAALVGLALTDRWYLLVPLWLLAGLGVSGLFVLGHDASHKALLRSNRANRLVARLCMIPSAHVEAAWDLGHNRIHHGYTARQGFDFVWHPATPEEYASLGWYARLQHRLEWSWVGSGAYFLRTVWWQKMMRFRSDDKRGLVIRKDKRFLLAAEAVLVLVAAAIGLWRGGVLQAIWMPVKLLVVPFLLFTHIIGWTVYVHHISPEIRWWPRRQWSQFKGQMEATTILRLPRFVNLLWFHNIFVHVPHHVDARIPFHALPRAAKAIVANFPDVVRTQKFRMRDYLRATRTCKLYDFERGVWLPYRDAAAASSAPASAAPSGA